MHEALEAAIRRFAAAPSADELDAALLVSRTLDPDIDEAGVRGRVAEICSACTDPHAPWQLLAELDFRGDADDYDALDNSRIERVLERRRGIPITLGVLLIAVARQLGGAAQGINFPGHFLVRVGGQLVDPFLMAPVSAEQCLSRLPAAERTLPRDQLFAPAGTVAVALRMLNNLKFRFARAREWHRALDVLDAQMLLSPREPGLHLERGDYWQQLGIAAPARAAYVEAMHLCAGSQTPRLQQLRQQAQARLQSLSGRDDVIH
ncbi:MAG: transglutaminase-like domain-containing protein [Pseudomonadales bacterium]